MQANLFKSELLLTAPARQEESSVQCDSDVYDLLSLFVKYGW